jgi:hypothetical protein
VAAGATDRSSNGVNGHSQRIAVARLVTLEAKGMRGELSQHLVLNREAPVGQASAPTERLVIELPMVIERNVGLRLIEVVGMVPGRVRIERTDREVRAAVRIATGVTTLLTTAARHVLGLGRLGLPMVTGLRTAIGFNPTVRGVERGAGRLAAIASMMEVARVAAATHLVIVNHVAAEVVLVPPNIANALIVLPGNRVMVETVSALRYANVHQHRKHGKKSAASGKLEVNTGVSETRLVDHSRGHRRVVHVPIVRSNEMMVVDPVRGRSVLEICGGLLALRVIVSVADSALSAANGIETIGIAPLATGTPAAELQSEPKGLARENEFRCHLPHGRRRPVRSGRGSLSVGPARQQRPKIAQQDPVLIRLTRSCPFGSVIVRRSCPIRSRPKSTKLLVPAVG